MIWEQADPSLPSAAALLAWRAARGALRGPLSTARAAQQGGSHAALSRCGSWVLRVL